MIKNISISGAIRKKVFFRCESLPGYKGNYRSIHTKEFKAECLIAYILTGDDYFYILGTKNPNY